MKQSATTRRVLDRRANHIGDLCPCSLLLDALRELQARD